MSFVNCRMSISLKFKKFEFPAQKTVLTKINKMQFCESQMNWYMMVKQTSVGKSPQGPWSGHELKFQSINVFPNSRIFLSFGDVYLKKSPNVSLAKGLQTAYFHKIVLHVNVLFKCLVNTP